MHLSCLPSRHLSRFLPLMLHSYPGSWADLHLTCLRMIAFCRGLLPLSLPSLPAPWDHTSFEADFASFEVWYLRIEWSQGHETSSIDVSGSRSRHPTAQRFLRKRTRNSLQRREVLRVLRKEVYLTNFSLVVISPHIHHSLVGTEIQREAYSSSLNSFASLPCHFKGTFAQTF